MIRQHVFLGNTVSSSFFQLLQGTCVLLHLNYPSHGYVISSQVLIWLFNSIKCDAERENGNYLA